MKKPVLSVCIPNYRRPEFLKKNLEAIAKQNHKDLEVVVSDDCSPEDIKSVVKNFQQKHLKVSLKFKRHSKNLGFDKNVLATVNLAKGQYCWLLSNDDQILPGAIKKILKTINQNPKISLILVNYQRFDLLVKKITSKKMISVKKDKLYRDASNFFFDQTNNSYFKHLGLNCLTMSVDVFNRRYWLKAIKSLDQYIGHNFIHFFALASIIQAHPFIYLISSPQLRYTSNNHRIWSNPIWHDIRHYFLDHLLDLGYDRNKTFTLKKKLKKDEFNEKLFLLSQKHPRFYRLTFPLVRRIRRFLGHHV